MWSMIGCQLQKHKTTACDDEQKTRKDLQWTAESGFGIQSFANEGLWCERRLRRLLPVAVVDGISEPRGVDYCEQELDAALLY